MTDHHSNMSEISTHSEETPPTSPISNGNNKYLIGHYDPIANFSSKLLDRSDSLIYSIVGMCFFLGGFVALGYSFWDFYYLLATSPLTPPNVAKAIIQLVSDLLLVLIIME